MSNKPVRLNLDLAAIDRAIQQPAMAAHLATVSETLKRRTYANTPKRRSANLARSTNYKVAEDDGKLVGIVYQDYWTASLVEFGTGKTPPVGQMRRAAIDMGLRFKPS